MFSTMEKRQATMRRTELVEFDSFLGLVASRKTLLNLVIYKSPTLQGPDDKELDFSKSRHFAKTNNHVSAIVLQIRSQPD